MLEKLRPANTIPRRDLARLLRDASNRRSGEAAARIFEAYAGRLHGLAFRILLDRDAAEDAVQEVFLALLGGKARYLPRPWSHPEAFLFRIASHIAMDGASRRGRKEVPVPERDERAESRSIDEGVLREELQAEIGGLVEALSPEERAAVALRFWGGATVREMASILSTSRSTAERWLQGSLEKLRKGLVRRGLAPAAAAALLPDLLDGMVVPGPSAAFLARAKSSILFRVQSGAPATAAGVAAAWIFSSAGTLKCIAVVLALGAAGGAALHLARSPSGLEDGVAVDRRAADTLPTPEASLTGDGGDRIRGGEAPPAPDPMEPERLATVPVAPADSPEQAAAGPAEPDPETEIAGRALRSDGSPVEGAVVRIDIRMAKPPPMQAKSGPDGSFRFTGLEPGSMHEFQAAAPSLVACPASASAGTSDLEMVFYRSGTILGRFVDARGEPLGTGGIEYKHEYRDAVGRAHTWNKMAEYEALADGGFKVKGALDLAGLTPGTYRLRVLGTGPQPALSGWTDPIPLEEGETARGIEVVALAAVAVTGRVVDEASGLPIAGASVKGLYEGESPPYPVLRTTSDGDGRFRLEGIPRGHLDLYASAEEYETYEGEVVVIGDRDEEVTLKMSPPPPAPPETRTDLRILVVDSAGRPLAGARVKGPFKGGKKWQVEARTDREGIAVFPVTFQGGTGAGKGPGRFQPKCVFVEAEGKRRDQIFFDAEILQAGSVTVTLRTPGTIEGAVFDHEGQPMGGIEVFALGKDASGRALTSKDGTYSIGGLGPGNHEVVVFSEKRPIPRSRREVAVEEGKTVRLDLNVADPATALFPVKVSLTFDDGTPIGHKSIGFRGAWAGDKPEGRKVFPVDFLKEDADFSVDAEGKAVLHFDEPVGLIRCQARYIERDGYPYRQREESDREIIRVEAGEARIVFDRMPTCEDLTIRVVDAGTGRPLAPYSYDLDFVGASEDGEGGICRSPDGEVHCKAPAGEVKVRIEAEGYRDASRKITVEDRGRHRLEFALERAAPEAR
jgi:RNA polymerase sigma-70 factor (ECF subfamily)